MTIDTAENRRFYFISTWLGLATIVAWVISFVVIKYR